VNFHKGLCRLTFGGNAGAIVLQSYVLADGQSCLKAVLSWQGSNQVGYESVYPQGHFDWLTAPIALASAWSPALLLPRPSIRKLRQPEAR